MSHYREIKNTVFVNEKITLEVLACSFELTNSENPSTLLTAKTKYGVRSPKFIWAPVLIG
jgi:hypothetical protein